MSNSKQVYKSQGNVSLFDIEETMEILNAMGNPLEKLSKVIDFEIFREILESNLQKERLTNAGARPYDPVLMFKVLIIQRMYNLGDKQTEFQIRDRISFRDFLGLASGDKVPDEKTIWLFRENLIKKHVFEQLFDEFYQLLESKHMIMNVGTIIDGSFVEVPRQRNSREENKLIKEGKSDMRKHNMKDRVIKRNVKGKKISKRQETINRNNSKIRVRVEHAFGYCEGSMHSISSRLVGFVRNAAFIIFTNLVYNMNRYEQILRLGMN